VAGEEFEVITALLALITNIQDGPAAIGPYSLYDRSLAGRRLNNIDRMN